MKYCHNCGAPLVDDVRFCTACGSPLDPPETEPAMPESAVMPEMPEPAPEMPVMPGEALPPEPPKKRKKTAVLRLSTVSIPQKYAKTTVLIKC